MKAFRICMLATALAIPVTMSLAALADNPPKTGPSPTSGSDAGPFPPSMSNAAPAQPIAPSGVAPNPPPAIATASQPANSQPVVAPAITPARQRAIESEMDRAEREADKARASQPVNTLNPGGYDGTTSEKNR